METQEKTDAKPTGLELLRAPFLPHQISKLPKPTKSQTDAVKADFKKGIRCKLCGQWHHPDVVHLDYVGHAALTDRLLDCDQNWNWEPIAFNADGSPALDQNGGMWIRLTVCGVTRMGYGHPDGKRGGDAVKEVIGDALRNAAMRFGAALDLWHKGDLHGPDEATEAETNKSTRRHPQNAKPVPEKPHALQYGGADAVTNEDLKTLGRKVYAKISEAQSADDVDAWLTSNAEGLELLSAVDESVHAKIMDHADKRKGALNAGN